MKAEKIFLATPLLCWYIEHGLVVTKVYKAVEYIPKLVSNRLRNKLAKLEGTGMTIRTPQS